MVSDGDNQKLKSHIKAQILENRKGTQNSLNLLAIQQISSPKPKSKNTSMRTSQMEIF